MDLRGQKSYPMDQDPATSGSNLLLDGADYSAYSNVRRYNEEKEDIHKDCIYDKLLIVAQLLKSLRETDPVLALMGLSSYCEEQQTSDPTPASLYSAAGPVPRTQETTDTEIMNANAVVGEAQAQRAHVEKQKREIGTTSSSGAKNEIWFKSLATEILSCLFNGAVATRMADVEDNTPGDNDVKTVFPSSIAQVKLFNRMYPSPWNSESSSSSAALKKLAVDSLVRKHTLDWFVTTNFSKDCTCRFPVITSLVLQYAASMPHLFRRYSAIASGISDSIHSAADLAAYMVNNNNTSSEASMKKQQQPPKKKQKGKRPLDRSDSPTQLPFVERPFNPSLHWYFGREKVTDCIELFQDLFHHMLLHHHQSGSSDSSVLEDTVKFEVEILRSFEVLDGEEDENSDGESVGTTEEAKLSPSLNTYVGGSEFRVFTTGLVTSGAGFDSEISVNGLLRLNVTRIAKPTDSENREKTEEVSVQVNHMDISFDLSVVLLNLMGRANFKDAFTVSGLMSKSEDDKASVMPLAAANSMFPAGDASAVPVVSPLSGALPAHGMVPTTQSSSMEARMPSGGDPLGGQSRGDQVLPPPPGRSVVQTASSSLFSTTAAPTVATPSSLLLASAAPMAPSPILLASRCPAPAPTRGNSRSSNHARQAAVVQALNNPPPNFGNTPIGGMDNRYMMAMNQHNGVMPMNTNAMGMVGMNNMNMGTAPSGHPGQFHMQGMMQRGHPGGMMEGMPVHPGNMGAQGHSKHPMMTPMGTQPIYPYPQGSGVVGMAPGSQPKVYNQNNARPPYDPNNNGMYEPI